jgi:predicted DNA-binding antitoxin AbrB/MazE fold protein
LERIKEPMQQILNAVYEKGVFRPLQHPDIAEGQQVRLVVETSAPLSPDEILELAGQVYEGLSEQEIDEIEEIALDRKNFFGERTASE